MTFIDLLNNPATREMIDAIEDTRASLEGKEGDTILQDVLARQIAELEQATGYTYEA